MTTSDIRFRLTAGVFAIAMAFALTGGPRARGAENEPASRGATASSTQSAAEQSARDLRASKVIGMTVRNAQGEKLGKIDDLVMDVHNDRVAYAVLSFGGALGLGAKLFAYPLALFQPAAGRADEMVLNVDKDRLKSAPGFETKNWPDWNKDKYRSDVDRYFGPTVTAKTMPNQRLERASDLIGKNVDDRNGKRAGELKDIVVNLGTAQVHYAVLDFDKAWSTDDKLLPISMKALTFPEQASRNLQLNLAKTDLDMSYGFDEKRWPDVSDPAYRRRIDSYIGRTATMPAPAGQAGPTRE